MTKTQRAGLLIYMLAMTCFIIGTVILYSDDSSGAILPLLLTIPFTAIGTGMTASSD